jgi:hypothetical protein
MFTDDLSRMNLSPCTRRRKKDHVRQFRRAAYAHKNLQDLGSNKLLSTPTDCAGSDLLKRQPVHGGVVLLGRDRVGACAATSSSRPRPSRRTRFIPTVGCSPWVVGRRRERRRRDGLSAGAVLYLGRLIDSIPGQVQIHLRELNILYLICID